MSVVAYNNIAVANIRPSINFKVLWITAMEEQDSFAKLKWNTQPVVHVI